MQTTTDMLMAMVDQLNNNLKKGQLKTGLFLFSVLSCTVHQLERAVRPDVFLSVCRGRRDFRRGVRIDVEPGNSAEGGMHYTSIETN